MKPPWIDLTPRWIDLTPLWIDLAPPWIDLTPHWIDLIPPWIDLTPLDIAFAFQWGQLIQTISKYMNLDSFFIQRKRATSFI